MSSSAGIQNLQVNVFRPVYTYDSNTGIFVPSLDLANVAYAGTTLSALTIGVGDAAGNVYVGSNAGNAYNDIRNCTNNTVLGYGAGELISNVSNSVYLGASAGANTSNASNVIAIGSNAGGSGISNIFVGTSTGATGSNNILLGHGITAGSNSDILRIGSTIYGNLSNRWIGIGTDTPLDADTRLDVSGDAFVSGILSAGAFDVSSGAISSSNLVVSGYLRNNVTPTQFDISGGNISNSAVHTTTGLVATYLRNALTPTQFDISGGNIRNFGMIQTGTGYTLAVDTCDSITGISNVRTHAGAFVGINESQYLANNTEWPLLYSHHFSNGIWTHKAGNTQGSLIFKTFNSTATAERMRIRYDGNVGIGTSNPLGKLDVVGGISMYGLVGNGTARPAIATGSNLPDYEIRAYNGGGGDDGFMRLRAGGYANATSASYIDLTGFNTLSENSRNIVFGTRGLERMRIDPSGNVGIGLTNPSVLLDVCGDVIVGGSVSSNLLRFRGTTDDFGSNNTVIAERVYGGIEQAELVLFKGNDPAATSGPDRIRYRGAQHVFQTYTGTEDWSSLTDNNTRLFVANNGNVGIGTVGPQTVLDVSGRVRILQDGSSSLTSWGLNTGTDSLIIQHTGNYSNVADRGKSASILFANALPNYPQARIVSEMTGVTTASYSANLIFQTNSLGIGLAERMRIDSNGNVGIGMTDPQNTLDVSGTLRVLSSNGTGAFWVSPGTSYGNTNLNGYFTIFSPGTTSGAAVVQLTPEAGAPHYLMSNNVGIGTRSPQSALDVSGGVSTGTFRNNSAQATVNLVGNGLTDNLGLQMFHGSNLMGLYSASTTIPFSISTSNARRMTILSNGNVGIGTTAPQYALDVSSSSTSAAAFFRNSSLQAALFVTGAGFSDLSGLQMYHGSVDQGLWNQNTQPLRFWTNGGRRMTILGNGNVGIATTDPQYLLDVSAGTSNASINMSSWPRAAVGNTLVVRGYQTTIVGTTINWGTVVNSINTDIMTWDNSNASTGSSFIVRKSGIWSISYYIASGTSGFYTWIDASTNNVANVALDVPGNPMLTFGQTANNIGVSWTGYLASNANVYYKIRSTHNLIARNVPVYLNISFLYETPTIAGNHPFA